MPCEDYSLVFADVMQAKRDYALAQKQENLQGQACHPSEQGNLKQDKGKGRQRDTDQGEATPLPPQESLRRPHETYRIAGTSTQGAGPSTSSAAIAQRSPTPFFAPELDRSRQERDGNPTCRVKRESDAADGGEGEAKVGQRSATEISEQVRGSQTCIHTTLTL